MFAPQRSAGNAAVNPMIRQRSKSPDEQGGKVPQAQRSTVGDVLSTLFERFGGRVAREGWPGVIGRRTGRLV
jgi:hypothetical protein